MRTTVDVPERLLRDAQRVAHTRTRNEAVRLALDEFVRRRRRNQLLALRGCVEIDDVTAELERAELDEAKSHH